MSHVEAAYKFYLTICDRIVMPMCPPATREAFEMLGKQESPRLTGDVVHDFQIILFGQRMWSERDERRLFRSAVTLS